MKKPKIKYLSNKELLIEIHKSKGSYCSYIDDEMYSKYDIIVTDVNDITPETIAEGKRLRAHRLEEFNARELLLQGENPKKFNLKIDPETIKDEEVVIRVMTFEHIPLDPGRKKNPKTEADRRQKVPFAPFKHYILEQGELREVGRSHWEGGIHNGWFSIEHGAITQKLAKMFMLLVNRYGTKPNWGSYSYNDEMKANALIQLVSVGLKFDESRSANPFAFYTQIMSNSFTGTFNEEKKNQVLRDDLLMHGGSKPSHTRMVENEMTYWTEKEKEKDET